MKEKSEKSLTADNPAPTSAQIEYRSPDTEDPPDTYISTSAKVLFLIIMAIIMLLGVGLPVLWLVQILN